MRILRFPMTRTDFELAGIAPQLPRVRSYAWGACGVELLPAPPLMRHGIILGRTLPGIEADHSLYFSSAADMHTPDGVRIAAARIDERVIDAIVGQYAPYRIDVSPTGAGMAYLLLDVQKPFNAAGSRW